MSTTNEQKATGFVPTSDFDLVAQISHTIGGALVILGPIAIFGPRYIWKCFVGLLIFATIKEFWYDETYETVDARGSSLKDFLFYMFGAFLAIGLYKISIKYKWNQDNPQQQSKPKHDKLKSKK